MSYEILGTKIKTTEDRVKTALGGLVEVYNYEIDGSQIEIWAKENRGYNLSAVIVNAMQKEGFFLTIITLRKGKTSSPYINTEYVPSIIFSTHKI